MAYQQLTQEQRYQIFAYREAGLSLREIAQRIQAHYSTISRELRRNVNPGEGYHPARAHQLSDQRRRKAFKMTKRLPCIINWVKDRLLDEWSPEQISGFLGLFASPEYRVSHEWVYRYIQDDQRQGGSLWTYLRLFSRRTYNRRLKKRAGCHLIPNRTGIEQRPDSVEQRLEVGHWEGDTILHGHRKSGLVTLVERRSGFLVAGRLKTFQAGSTADQIIHLLKPYQEGVQSLTFDNGVEFAQHDRVAHSLEAATYFCDPYRSSQRGSNENTNGLLRQYFPKKTDFNQVTQQQLEEVVEKLNNRPRKRLGYRTPAQIFYGELSGALETAGVALNG